jgi:ribosomal protein L7/L12
VAKRYEVVVDQFPEKYIPVLRVLRNLLGTGLKETKTLYNYSSKHCPCVFLAGVELELAEKLTRELLEVDVKVSIRESSLPNPMIVCPYDFSSPSLVSMIASWFRN